MKYLVIVGLRACPWLSFYYNHKTSMRGMTHIFHTIKTQFSTFNFILCLVKTIPLFPLKTEETESNGVSEKYCWCNFTLRNMQHLGFKDQTGLLWWDAGNRESRLYIQWTGLHILTCNEPCSVEETDQFLSSVSKPQKSKLWLIALGVSGCFLRPILLIQPPSLSLVSGQFLCCLYLFSFH